MYLQICNQLFVISETIAQGTSTSSKRTTSWCENWCRKCT